MDSKELALKISSLILEAELSETRQFVRAVVPPARMKKLIRTLRDSDDTLFDYLFCLSGVDEDDRLGCTYHLESTVYRHCVMIKTFASERENPVLDTISDLYKGAEFLEREVFDLYGIQFKNHPDLRRIFLDDDWVGHPLRKDYRDDINIIER